MRTTLLPVLGKYRACALLDYESMINPGDALLYMGARTLLSKAETRVAYEADPSTYDPAELRRALPAGGVVVFSGGGNMIDDGHGELLRFRISALEELTDYPIIQLPQSIHIGDPAIAKRFADAANAHPSYALFVRDTESLSRCVSYGVNATLCPDIAMATTLQRRALSTRNVLMIRDDVEARADANGAPTSEGWANARWVRSRALRSVTFYALRLVAATMRETGIKLLSRPTAALVGAYVHWLAGANVRFAERQVSAARVLVTDRLHGCIAAMLLDVPFVALDNSYGKIHAFFRTWMPDEAVKHCAASRMKAIAMAEKMLTTKP